MTTFISFRVRGPEGNDPASSSQRALFDFAQAVGGRFGFCTPFKHPLNSPGFRPAQTCEYAIRGLLTGGIFLTLGISYDLVASRGGKHGKVCGDGLPHVATASA
ncbi:hypothetical protein LSM04_007881 [Trypanosoma melophagium]|uniref:uncharacterized protein n=1 Tax=Trypanosoma melophagium TaxID=715481 RepID=UPI00351A5E7F|nr:hypothetical protein LSM04_007881 [Trypanosoma melophagium]